MGAVMGSKNLKAIAVQGHSKVPVIELERYNELRSEANRALRVDAVTQMFRELGTSGGAEYFDYLSEMPKRYFQEESFPEDMRISGASLKDTILVGVSACHACVIACGRVVRLEDGEKRKGPEYETLVGFGPNLGLNDPVFVTRMGEICDRIGMDSISLSNTIGLAFTLFEKGVINTSDTGGLELIWGDAQTVEKLVRMVACREGFGEWISRGSQALARRFNCEEEAVQVNGLEVAYHDPRGASGMALVYATSPRGACHNQSDYFLVDIGQVETSLGLDYHNRQGGAEKASNVARHQDWRTVFNSLVLCFFSNVPPETILALLNAACGMELTLEELVQSGERGWNLKRAINNRLGLRRENDTLPKAFLRQFRDHPGTLGFVPDFDAMLSAYYGARGWDPITGIPTADKLNELGLGWMIEDQWGPRSDR
jgi:aldehyde:ferredoxin oxidoreductase